LEKENKFNKYEYDKEYHKKNYDRINIVLKKGVREQIKAAAEKEGKSLNSFIVDAVTEKLK
jgi:uncharacterized protein (DUF1778 family)